MEYRIATATRLPAPARIETTLLDADPAAIFDIDPAGVLRIATSLDAAELVALLCAEGCPVASDQVLVLPSICCGGCSG